MEISYPRLVVGILGVIVVLAGGRYGCCELNQLGTGVNGSSSDGRYVASATQYHRPGFWGGDLVWVELTVRDAQTRRLVYRGKVDREASCRSEGTVDWRVEERAEESDSGSRAYHVRFNCPPVTATVTFDG